MSAAARTQPHTLRYHPRRRTALYRLPFAGGPTLNHSLWDVPALGDYPGGYQTGEALAVAYLKYLRSPERQWSGDNELVHILDSLTKRITELTQPEHAGQRLDALPIDLASLRGQRAGFLNTLNRWLISAAKQLGANLDQVDDARILQRASDGLRWENDYVRSRLDAANSAD